MTVCKWPLGLRMPVRCQIAHVLSHGPILSHVRSFHPSIHVLHLPPLPIAFPLFLPFPAQSSFLLLSCSLHSSLSLSPIRFSFRLCSPSLRLVALHALTANSLLEHPIRSRLLQTMLTSRRIYNSHCGHVLVIRIFLPLTYVIILSGKKIITWMLHTY